MILCLLSAQTPDGTMMSSDTIDDTLMTDDIIEDTLMTDDTINDTLMTNAMNNTMNNTMMNNEKMASLPDSDGGCLVATAAYGTELSQQVQLLREVRDVTLMNTVHGASFMTSFSQIYYTFSPVIADVERENSLLRGMLQTLLYPLLSSISIMTLSDGSEVQTLGLGLAVILFNILLYISAPIFAIYYIKRIILLKCNI
ncbi:MAG: CFI-box-CTERM domain-containing protein [Candidatus Nitrosoabyssus spongiisocia]|nr:MAG: CFI-box-CTERM domain-containing protein [Nitrosopumilaceae archaeon AB1(1)]